MPVVDLDQLFPEDTAFRFGGVTYPLRGELTVREMVKLWRLETEMGAVTSAEEFEAAFEKALEHLMGYVREKTPGAPDLDLTAKQLTAAFALLAGNESAVKEVLDTLHDGAGGGGEAPDKTTGGDDDDGSGAESGAPLPSKKRSRKTSSRSATSRSATSADAAGRPGTGTGSAGGRSGSTSAPPAERS